MAREIAREVDKFYSSLATVPNLIGELAQSVALAQARMDRQYVDSLAKFVEVVRAAVGEGVKPALPANATAPQIAKAKRDAADRFTSLFQAIAPSRYQFTETTLEVRADLQASSASSLGVDAGVGLKAGPFAVTVNASYTRRNSYDYRAAALIKTTLHAISSDETVMKALLASLEETPGIDLPKLREADAMGESLTELVKADEPPKDA